MTIHSDVLDLLQLVRITAICTKAATNNYLHVLINLSFFKYEVIFIMLTSTVRGWN